MSSKLLRLPKRIKSKKSTKTRPKLSAPPQLPKQLLPVPEPRNKRGNSNNNFDRHHHKAIQRLALHRGILHHKGTKGLVSKSTNNNNNRKLSTGFTAPDYLEQTQQLEWQNLNPGTQAPDYVPEVLRPIWAAGTALGTIFTNIPEILAQGQAGGGYHYPGMNYIGPGTPHYLNQVPVNQMDDLARIHDLQYAQLAEAGVNPYFTFNEADRYMLAHADLTTAEGWAVYIGIGMKQIFPDDYTPVEAIPPYNPRPALNGVGEDPTNLRPELSLQYEEQARMRGEMIQKIIQSTQTLIQNVNPQTTGLPFIQSLLSAGASSPQKRADSQQRPNPFLNLFLSGAAGSARGAAAAATGGGGFSRNAGAAAATVLSDGLRSASRSLRFLPPAFRSLPLTSVKSNVAQAASRRNMSVSSLIHKTSQRDYKRTGAFTQSIDQLQKLPRKSYVPSFVRR